MKLKGMEMYHQKRDKNQYLGRCQSSEALGSHGSGGAHEVQVGMNGLHESRDVVEAMLHLWECLELRREEKRREEKRGKRWR